MLRKTLLVSLLSTVMVGPSFAGFYIGAAGGPEGASFSQKSHVSRLGSFDVVDKEHFSGLGGFGSIFLGFGQQYDKFYLAAEGNLNLSSVKYQLTNEEYLHLSFSKTTFHIRTSEGISLLPGYYLSNKTLAYLRVGYINGNLKTRESDPTIRSFNKHLNGIRYGIGLKHDLTNRFAIRMDYSQINYASVKSRRFEPFGAVTKNTKISPSTAQVAFGLIYNFDEPHAPYTK